ncbi:gamma-glutamylcyclotransferase [Flavobacterium fluviale]|uniref:Gamma-glutamylcyclotransferase n=2 Tax=Flavobacterium fluviale TaxID=2249356 RepID=A0A344LYQ9_9FLAO|nr:gamma-glutamylcyclotransferase [Flavobacterium fluviale]
MTVHWAELLDHNEAEGNFEGICNPHQALIIYGTLSPGGPNHHIMEKIQGEWKKGIVKGNLINEGWGAALGYNAFTPCPVAWEREIPCHVLFSESLEEHLAYLDDFEGEDYRRIFAEYKLDDGRGGAAYIYAVKPSSSGFDS